MYGVYLKQVNDELYEFESKAPNEMNRIPELVDDFQLSYYLDELNFIRPIAVLTKSAAASKQRFNNPFFATIQVQCDESVKYIDNQYVIQQLVEFGLLSETAKFPASFNTLEKFYIASNTNDMLFKIDGLDNVDKVGDPIYYVIGAKFSELPTMKDIELLSSEFVVGLKALTLNNMRDSAKDKELLERLRLYRNYIMLPVPFLKPELEFYITEKQAAVKSKNKINLEVFRSNWLFYDEEVIK